MREASPRMLKVNSTLREVIAEEIERLNDARLEMVSITGVDTSPNLRRAIVYVDVLGEADTPAAIAALRRASSRIQAAIAGQVRMKFTPTLDFQVDPGVLGGERIEAILRSLDKDAEPDG
ncbi:MAG TPA: 30S ribosome-binding factor RbfA [Acidimicrobiia bacterium]|nr:30S ribosome-binding factor RbfA [Acidimicrobiia bacterium]